MIKISFRIFMAMTLFVMWHDAFGQKRSRLHTGDIAQIKISVPQKYGIGYRGSHEENIQLILRAPAVEVTVKDVGMIADFVLIASESEAESCGYQNLDEVSAVVSATQKPSDVRQYLVIKNRLYDREKSLCYKVPKFILRAIDI